MFVLADLGKLGQRIGWKNRGYHIMVVMRIIYHISKLQPV
jgi:hypothetical protein